MSDGEPIYCEVCGLPHRREVARCEECSHELGTVPDWGALRAEIPALKRDIGLGIAAIIAMLLVNIVLFGGAGYVVLLAPFGWTVAKAYRYSTLAKRANRGGRTDGP